MQVTDFAATAAGELVRITGGHAFVPENLPLALDLPLGVLRASDRARGALGEFMGQSTRVPNDLLVTAPLLTMEAIESNRIEGTHTVAAEVLRQRVAGPPADREQGDRNLEVLLYQDALRAGERWIREGRPLNEWLVRGLHGELLREGRGREASPGAYRTDQVLIGSRDDTYESARFVPPPPEQVPVLMANLGAYMTREPEYPALISCAITHYQIETIHPFKDGHGRVGRLMIPLYLLAHRIIDRPTLYVSAFFEDHREEYYDRLKAVSTQGDWEQWLLFFLEAVRVRAEDSKKKIERILLLRDSYQERVRGARSHAALPAIDLVMSQVYVTIPQVQAYAHCSYGAAKSAVAALQSLEILMPLQDFYPAMWAAPELFDEIYV